MPDWRSKSSRSAQRLFHDEDGAWRKANKALGRATNDLMVEPGMPHEPDDEQIEMLLAHQCHDRLDRVSGKKVSLDLDPSSSRLCSRRFEHRCEAMVRFALFLLDFVNARGKPRQLLDCHHVKGSHVPLRQ